MSDDGEWIDGAMLDDWRARDEAKNARIEALTAQLAQRDAVISAADDLARAAYMTGSVWSTPIPNALAAYRKARGQDA